MASALLAAFGGGCGPLKGHADTAFARGRMELPRCAQPRHHLGQVAGLIIEPFRQDIEVRWLQRRGFLPHA